MWFFPLIDHMHVDPFIFELAASCEGFLQWIYPKTLKASTSIYWFGGRFILENIYWDVAVKPRIHTMWKSPSRIAWGPREPLQWTYQWFCLTRCWIICIAPTKLWWTQSRWNSFGLDTRPSSLPTTHAVRMLCCYILHLDLREMTANILCQDQK